jgi:type I restriction enzyme S subunit
MSEVVHIPQLRFPEFSEEWLHSHISNLLTKLIDCEHKTAPYIEWSKHMVVRTNNIKDGRLHYNDIKYTSENSYLEWTRRGIPQPGDILFTREAPAGEFCLVPKDKSICMGQRIVLLKTNSKVINNIFLFYNLQTQWVKNQVSNLSIGTTVSRINIKDINRINCSLTSIDEQQKIAAFLAAVDRKIEQLSKKQELLGEYKKGLMQQIFSQAIRFKVDDGSDFPDWEEKNLGDVCSKAKSGGTPRSTTKEYYDGDIPFLAISDITKQGKYLTSASKKISQLGIDNSASWIVPIDTIIYSMYASVGLVSINKIPLATSQAVINLIVKDGYSIEFIYYHLIEIKKTIHKFIETGTQGNLNAQIVKSLILNIPSLPEQTKIASFLSSIDNKIKQVGKQIDESKQFKKALLQQMFV